MGNKTKSFAAVVALAFAVLFFGPGTSKAQAQYFGPQVSFEGHFPLPHGSINVYSGNGPYYRHHSYSPYYRYSRPYYGRSYSRYHRPYRLARFYTYVPYPHWAFRRVYYSAPYAGGFCPY